MILEITSWIGFAIALWFLGGWIISWWVRRRVEKKRKYQESVERVWRSFDTKTHEMLGGFGKTQQEWMKEQEIKDAVKQARERGETGISEALRPGQASGRNRLLDRKTVEWTKADAKLCIAKHNAAVMKTLNAQEQKRRQEWIESLGREE